MGGTSKSDGGSWGAMSDGKGGTAGIAASPLERRGFFFNSVPKLLVMVPREDRLAMSEDSEKRRERLSVRESGSVTC